MASRCSAVQVGRDECRSGKNWPKTVLTAADVSRLRSSSRERSSRRTGGASSSDLPSLRHQLLKATRQPAACHQPNEWLLQPCQRAHL